MTNSDICSLIYSFDNNAALKFGKMADIKTFPFKADWLLGLSQYSMSPALSAYVSWLLAARSQFFNLINAYLWEDI